MPVRNCCTGCQGPMAGPCGPCGPMSYRKDCCGNDVGPCCVSAAYGFCNAPCDVRPGVLHGARGGIAASYFSCGGEGCIGGCRSGLCASCCGPACG